MALMGLPLSGISPPALRFSANEVSAFLSPSFSILLMALRSLAGLLLKQYSSRLQTENKHVSKADISELSHFMQGGGSLQLQSYRPACQN